RDDNAAPLRRLVARWRELSFVGMTIRFRSHGTTRHYSLPQHSTLNTQLSSWPPLPRITLGKHHTVRSGIESFEQLFHQPRFHPAGFARHHQVSNNRLQPCIVTHSKKD